MKHVLCALMILGLVMSAAPRVHAEETKWDNLLTESARVFEEIMQMPEKSIPTDLLKNCQAIAIFPSTVSGGFIVGAKFGQGVILNKDKAAKTWSAPAVFNIGGGSFGFQIGGQATDIVLVISSERGVDGLLRSKFQLGADAAVSAGPIGRDTQASTDAQLKGMIFSYSRSRGLFAGVKLEGAVVSQNQEGNKALYKKEVTAKDILVNRTVKPTASAQRLIKDLTEKAF